MMDSGLAINTFLERHANVTKNLKALNDLLVELNEEEDEEECVCQISGNYLSLGKKDLLPLVEKKQRKMQETFNLYEEVRQKAEEIINNHLGKTEAKNADKD
ncbi:hypothetical protein KAR91_36970 [Candidatus Pacearchaeota archaeon]|nr:hypothetical protein [Candidatus Pacearchaeota archaeon]